MIVLIMNCLNLKIYYFMDEKLVTIPPFLAMFALLFLLERFLLASPLFEWIKLLEDLFSMIDISNLQKLIPSANSDIKKLIIYSIVIYMR